MPRLNLGLRNGENVKSSLTKVNRKNEPVELPVSWLAKRGSLCHSELAEFFREKTNRRKKMLDQNNWVLCDRNVFPD
jgi:hypothetical protein